MNAVKFLAILSLVCLLCPLRVTATTAVSDSSYTVIEELDVKVGMRDGVRLSANIYRPDSGGRFPALLMRTPYGNGGPGSSLFHFFACRGYAVVVQDCRGRYESEGVFDAFQSEREDGYDTQEWVASQPWCNGSLGTFGGSYVGFTQWLPAPLAHPALRTMFPVVTFADHHDMVYSGGAFRIRLFTAWSLEMTRPFMADSDWLGERMDGIFRALPLMEQDRSAGWRVPFLRDWLSHPLQDTFWEGMTIRGEYPEIRASSCNVGGWFDICLAGTLENFIRMTSPEIPARVRNRQKLIIGPWIHGISRGPQVGELDFGEQSVLDFRQVQLEWFDSELKGMENGIWEQPPVKIFVMGENRWRHENEWPLARTEYTNYYLHSGGEANTLDGDGTLSTERPGNEPRDRYTYNPDDPVPSAPMEPTDQSGIEGRGDVLVYTSETLEEALEVTGPVRALIYATSSATNTDFTAKLVDVYPDGRAMKLCEGIIRASFRRGDTLSVPIMPGEVNEYGIDLWATSNVFLPGHRIRVEVSSSNFPRFDRNPNTGGVFAQDSAVVSARQEILHTAQYPSHIILPVIE